MTPHFGIALAAVAAAAVLSVSRGITAQDAQHPDTATVKLRISGMTCGSCPITARAALKKLAGVLSATVTLDDSLGVVVYDRRKLTPAQISAQLARRTGYRARVLSDSGRTDKR